MRNSIYIYTLALTFLSSAGLAQENENQPLPGAIQEKISLYVKQFPVGTEFSVGIYHGGNNYVAHAYYEENGAITITEQGTRIFEIGSITKVFTASVLMMKVKANAVQLSDPAVKYLPVNLKKGSKGENITLLQLATHTSGLPSLPDNIIKDIQLYPDNPYSRYDEKRLYKGVTEEFEKLISSGNYTYSNFGMGLTGHILSLQAKTSYEDLIRQNICAPLGMNSTFITLPRTHEHRLVSGRDSNGNITSNWNMASLAGAGAFKSTTEDMLKFIQANLNPGTSLYPVFAECKKPYAVVNEDISMGIGWHLRKLETGKNIAFHNGGTGGYRSCLAIDEENKTGVVILSNVSSYSNKSGLIDELCFDILKSYKLVQTGSY